jgi:hypothetical protein
MEDAIAISKKGYNSFSRRLIAVGFKVISKVIRECVLIVVPGNVIIANLMPGITCAKNAACHLSSVRRDVF